MRDKLFSLVERTFDPEGMKLEGSAEDLLFVGFSFGEVAGGTMIEVNGTLDMETVRFYGSFFSSASFNFKVKIKFSTSSCKVSALIVTFSKIS